jgi:hypothetical protein
MKLPVLETDKNGNKFWKLSNGHHHKEDGPAIEHASGSKWWYQDDVLHREDGPAIIYPSGTIEWWYRGTLVNCSSQEEFERILKLKAFW